MYTSFVVSFKAWLQSEEEEQAHSTQLSFCRPLTADTSEDSMTFYIATEHGYCTSEHSALNPGFLEPLLQSMAIGSWDR